MLNIAALLNNYINKVLLGVEKHPASACDMLYLRHRILMHRTPRTPSAVTLMLSLWDMHRRMPLRGWQTVSRRDWHAVFWRIKVWGVGCCRVASHVEDYALAREACHVVGFELV